MIELELTKGYTTVIDDDDYELINQFKWSLLTSSQSQRLYAYSAIKGLLHRFVMNAPPDMDVDHIDGDGLNNIKVNMRIASRSENLMNKDKFQTEKGESNFKGVDFYPNYGQWRARITKNKHTYHLGYFHDEEMAAKAYDLAAVELYGNVPLRLNFKTIFADD